jgi:1,4-dihydroxy-6-naphthoate synthase
MRIRLAHSPDPDDAFMFYGLSSGAVDAGPYRFEHVLEDIQTLNERAARGEYEVSAVSIHAYPYVAQRYALCSCGASMGEGYGPMVVARRPLGIDELVGRRIAVPGLTTTACLVLQLLLGREGFVPRVVMFDRIPQAVAQGEFEVGLVIHEGQLTWAREGLHLVVDLGSWWLERTGLPLPLGGNVIRRDLGPGRIREIHRILRESICYGLAHRAEALEYALGFGRGLDRQLADRFVGMYVNAWTVDYGPRGRQAVRRLLDEGAAAGIVPPVGPIDFVD